MRKIRKKRAKEQSAAGQLRFPFHGIARGSLYDAAILSGFGFVQDELVAVPSQKLNPDILVMQPTQNWDGCDGAALVRAPNIRRILL
ncbi:MAG: hypothetical protein ABSD31_18780 [Candidatus Binataceae bacterium]|jgi:hypothetical protein